jgi:hypothetical protein
MPEQDEIAGSHQHIEVKAPKEPSAHHIQANRAALDAEKTETGIQDSSGGAMPLCLLPPRNPSFRFPRLGAVRPRHRNYTQPLPKSRSFSSDR